MFTLCLQAHFITASARTDPQYATEQNETGGLELQLWRPKGVQLACAKATKHKTQPCSMQHHVLAVIVAEQLLEAMSVAAGVEASDAQGCTRCRQQDRPNLCESAAAMSHSFSSDQAGSDGFLK